MAIQTNLTAAAGTVGVATLMAVMGAAGTGCVVKTENDAERFREAVPQSSDVALDVPGGTAATSGTSTKSIHILGNGGASGASSNARYYKFTRDMTDTVDKGTAEILGAIQLVVGLPPTTLDAKHAVWGPYDDANALEPVIWRFTATEVGTDEYDYVLEGQAKAAGPSSPFVAVLNGHGFGKASPSHRQGWLEADNDAYRTLDPDRAKDAGSTKITYDLRQLPATITVELDNQNGIGDTGTVVVTHDTGGAGTVEITAHSDIDDSKSTQLEDVHILSKWLSTGAGRADIVMQGGDLPITVDASECWSSSFARVYYKDTVDFEAPSGDVSACAIQAPQP